MKKSAILFLALFLTIGMLSSSCSRKKSCKGGGWYGDRHLGVAPQKNKTDRTYEIIAPQNIEDECDDAV